MLKPKIFSIFCITELSYLKCIKQKKVSLNMPSFLFYYYYRRQFLINFLEIFSAN